MFFSPPENLYVFDGEAAYGPPSHDAKNADRVKQAATHAASIIQYRKAFSDVSIALGPLCKAIGEQSYTNRLPAGDHAQSARTTMLIKALVSRIPCSSSRRMRQRI